MKSAVKASIVVALVFIVGFLSGAGAFSFFNTLRAESREGNARDVFRPSFRRAPAYSSRIERLAGELNLTPEQRAQFEPILSAGMERIHELRRQHRPAVREVLMETRAALCGMLDEEQCRRFDELSRIPEPGTDYRGFGRCLEDEPAKRYRRGSGHGRGAETQGQHEHRSSR